MNSGIGGGVVDKATPQSNANKTNCYVHICTFTYLNGVGA